MKILNEHSRWWKGVEKEWAVEDKDGHWWIYRNENKKETKPKLERKGQNSHVVELNFFLVIAFASLFGISLALNVVYYLM